MFENKIKELDNKMVEIEKKYDYVENDLVKIELEKDFIKSLKSKVFYRVIQDMRGLWLVPAGEVLLDALDSFQLISEEQLYNELVEFVKEQHQEELKDIKKRMC